MDVNGEAIYGTHSWVEFKEAGGHESALNVRFTVKGNDLYAIILGNWPSERATIHRLSADRGKVAGVSLLGSDAKLDFSQSADGLTVKLPLTAPCKYAYTLKVTGLKMNPAAVTKSGNPE
jgi:alpha-L-fucosidase